MLILAKFRGDFNFQTISDFIGCLNLDFELLNWFGISILVNFEKQIFQFWSKLVLKKCILKDSFLYLKEKQNESPFMPQTPIWTINSKVELWGILLKRNTSKHCAVHKSSSYKSVSPKKCILS